MIPMSGLAPGGVSSSIHVLTHLRNRFSTVGQVRAVTIAITLRLAVAVSVAVAVH